VNVKIGCCGFPTARKTYYRTFPLVELQSTFYKLPRERTVMRWREEAPPSFEFSVKAWQVITHPATSPTWRRMKTRPKDIGRYGLLKPTRQNFEAWDAIRHVCDLLRSRICLVQCPPQFSPSPKNIRNLTAFFSEIDRHGIIIAWEPRGEWTQKLGEIRRICEELDLIHVVDPLRRAPSLPAPVAYLRLHGLGRREFNYSYNYSDQDLSRLSQEVSNLEGQGTMEAYVLFNNISMLDDAKRFSAVVLAK